MEIKKTFCWQFARNIYSIAAKQVFSALLVIYYIKHSVPYRHVFHYHSLRKGICAIEAASIPYSICAGTLLGAVRQGAFAGRPADLDLYLDCHREQARGLVENLLKSWWFRSPEEKADRFQIWCGTRNSNVLLDLCFSTEVSMKNPWYEGHISFSPVKLITGGIEYKIYQTWCRVPVNFEEYLFWLYGPSWRLPDSRQYAWMIPSERLVK